MIHPNIEIMKKAIEEAISASKDGQYSIGAVVVTHNGKIISVKHTTTHKDNDPTNHAEINAIRDAAKIKGSRYLEDCWLYSTLEPCPMCASAAIWAKMKGIVFGANRNDATIKFTENKDSKFTWRQIDIDSKDIISKGNPLILLHENFMRDECVGLIK